MSKLKKLPTPSQSRGDMNRGISEAPAMPGPNLKIIAIIAGAVVFVWVMAFLLKPYMGYWGIGIAGVVTAVVVGFGLYVWNFYRKQMDLLRIMQTAQSGGTDAALAELAQGKEGDAMREMMRAQLVAQQDPDEAERILENINVEKAPAMIRDDIRANLALMYLMRGKIQKAKPLVVDMKPEHQANPKSKMLMLTVSAETYARTGEIEQGKKLIDQVKIEPGNDDILPLILRARAYVYFYSKNRGLAKKAMVELAQVDPNHLAAFIQTSAKTPMKKPSEIGMLAMEALQDAGFQGPRQKMKFQRN